MIPHEPALRDRIVANLAAHPLHEVPQGREKRAAVAIVVVASQAGSDTVDPYPDLPERMDGVPGDVRGYDGSVSGVAGGAAFLLCRRAATLNRHGGQWAYRAAGWTLARRRRRPRCANWRRSWA